MPIRSRLLCSLIILTSATFGANTWARDDFIHVKPTPKPAAENASKSSSALPFDNQSIPTATSAAPVTENQPTAKVAESKAESHQLSSNQCSSHDNSLQKSLLVTAFPRTTPTGSSAGALSDAEHQLPQLLSEQLVAKHRAIAPVQLNESLPSPTLSNDNLLAQQIQKLARDQRSQLVLTGEIVDMGNGLEVDYEPNPKAAKDKIVLIYIDLLEGSKKELHNLHRSEKAAIAISHGAKGVIIFNQVDKDVLLTGTASVTGELIPIPAVCIGKENGMALKEKLKTKKIQAHLLMSNHSDVIKARNVVATLNGSKLPEERIIIGGHLDSWDLATGAIDNGIGSFSILDMARAFKANKLAPKRTIQFVMFMGEEQGLLGSRYMVDQAVKDGSIESMKYMMNCDMSGNPIGVNAGGQLEDSTFYKSLGAEIQKIDTIYRNKFTNRSGLHSDHQPFMLQGVPILSMHANLDRSIYRCYHSDCDDFNLVNEEHLMNTVRFGTMILYGLANADKLPARKMDSEMTKQFMIDNNLKEPLIIAGDWKWEK